MREPAAKPFFMVLELLRERAPRLVILENVMGITTVMAKVLKDIERLGLYSIFVIPIDSKDLGEPVARPRLYFLLVRMDVRVCDYMTKLGNLAEKMCLAARAPVTEHMKTLMLPSTSPVVQQMGRAPPRQKKTQATQKQKTQRWPERLRTYRQQKGLPANVSSSGGRMVQGLTSERAEHIWKTTLEEHPGADVIANVSQSAGRNSVSVQGICPAVTPGSKLGVQSCGRTVLGVEKLLLHLFPLHRMNIPSGMKDGTLGKLGGNTMHLKSVALALAIGVAMVDWSQASSSPTQSHSKVPDPCFVLMERPASTGQAQAKKRQLATTGQAQKKAQKKRRRQ